jgi:hypothetical protein
MARKGLPPGFLKRGAKGNGRGVKGVVAKGGPLPSPPPRKRVTPGMPPPMQPPVMRPPPAALIIRGGPPPDEGAEAEGPPPAMGPAMAAGVGGSPMRRRVAQAMRGGDGFLGMEADLIPIDEAELKRLTAQLRATSYHEHLERYVEERIAYLLDKDLTKRNEIAKCRGQVEELSHLLRPAFAQTLALLGLRARAERDAAAIRPEKPTDLPRDWWVDPPDVASERPVP